MDDSTTGGLVPVKLHSGYVVRLQLYPDVGELSYKGARVHEKEIRTAAPDVGGGSTEVARAARVRVALQQAGVPADRGFRALLGAVDKVGKHKVKDLGNALRLGYHEARLKQYRPDYDTLPGDDKIGLLTSAARHVEAERAAQRFFEYGGPGGLPRHPIGDVERDVRAAEAKDALGWPYSKIGETFGIPLDEDYFKLKGSNKRAEDAVRRGRKLLIQALGEEGYRTHTAAVQCDLRRWYSLGADEREMEEGLDALGRLLGRALARGERREIEGELAEHFGG
jgi:hypothetical protein